MHGLIYSNASTAVMGKRAVLIPLPMTLKKDLRVTLAPKPEYHSPTSSPTPSRPERRRVSSRRIIDTAKAEVTVIDLMTTQASGKIRKSGAEVVTNCVLPDHEDRTPSFTANPEKNVWWCHGCLRGGDVVELARFLWGYEKHEVAMAAADLLHEFGHPIPERPASWYRRQERQKPIRAGIEAALIRTARRRLYKRYFEPIVASTVDPEDRAQDEQELWEVTLRLAEHLVGAMMRGR